MGANCSPKPQTPAGSVSGTRKCFIAECSVTLCVAWPFQWFLRNPILGLESKRAPHPPVCFTTRSRPVAMMQWRLGRLWRQLPRWCRGYHVGCHSCQTAGFHSSSQACLPTEMSQRMAAWLCQSHHGGGMSGPNQQMRFCFFADRKSSHFSWLAQS